MKKFILCLSLLLVLLSNFECNNPEEHELAKFFTEKGFDDSDELTRDQFIDLIDYLLTKTVDPKQSAKLGFKKFIPKNCEHIPEKFKKDDINKYISEDILVNVMNDFIDSKYPGKKEK